MLQSLESLSTETSFDGGTLWCYGQSNAVPSIDVGRRIQIHEGVPDNFENEGNKQSLIIIDDVLNNVYSKEVCHLFTKGSQYTKISVILITKKLFHQARYSRYISLNTKFSVPLKKISDKYQFTQLARQVYREEERAGLYKAYLEATKKAHGYFLLDFSQDTDDRLRFRNNIFPNELPTALYTP